MTVEPRETPSLSTRPRLHLEHKIAVPDLFLAVDLVGDPREGPPPSLTFERRALVLGVDGRGRVEDDA